MLNMQWEGNFRHFFLLFCRNKCNTVITCNMSCERVWVQVSLFQCLSIMRCFFLCLRVCFGDFTLFCCWTSKQRPMCCFPDHDKTAFPCSLGTPWWRCSTHLFEIHHLLRLRRLNEMCESCVEPYQGSPPFLSLWEPHLNSLSWPELRCRVH